MGAAQRSQGGRTSRAGRQGVIPAGRRAGSGLAGKAPGCAPGRAGPCSSGPEPELHERALGSCAREEPVRAGARRLWGAGGPWGWRQRTGLEPGRRGSQLAGTLVMSHERVRLSPSTERVAPSASTGPVLLSLYRHRVHGENTPARPPVHFPWSVGVPTRYQRFKFSFED